MSKTAHFGIAAALAASMATPALAQDPSPERVRALIQQALAQMPAAPQGTQPAAAGPQGPSVDLTADQAVARALERNLALASQRLTPRTYDYSLAATRASYRPNLNMSFSNNSQTQLPTTTVEGGVRVNNDTRNWNGGINQSLPFHGGSYSVNWTNNRVFTDRNNATFNPSFGSTLRAQYTQPLLQNFRFDNTRSSLETTMIQQDVAELDLRATTASTVAQVRSAYWELVYAYQAVEAAQRSLELASKLVDDNRARVEIGTMAPIDVVQAQAEEATRRQQLVIQQATLQNNELALKRLIVSGTDDELWNVTINPVDRPSPIQEPVDLETAVRNALQNRTDLQASRKNIDSANVSLRGLRNSSLPSLNLVTTYQLDGRGGTSIPLNPSIPIVRGGYLDALRNIGSWDAPTWNVSLQFSYPLGESAAEANMARQRLIIQQNQAQIKASELQIATEVTAAVLAVQNSWESLQAAQASRELSAKRLEAAQSKFDVGMATNFEVVQAQRDLNDARNSELRQLLNYRRALVDYERVQISPR
ncbi:MAG TPA: TolC family protein [Vicinamibacterales bacterium]|nr:TolC family protein [Vicinamibacterales bacterium]